MAWTTTVSSSELHKKNSFAVRDTNAGKIHYLNEKRKKLKKRLTKTIAEMREVNRQIMELERNDTL